MKKIIALAAATLLITSPTWALNLTLTQGVNTITINSLEGMSHGFGTDRFFGSGAVGETNTKLFNSGVGDGFEDYFGIFRAASILPSFSLPGAAPGTEVLAVFYGFDETQYFHDAIGSDINLQSKGGRIEFYATPSWDGTVADSEWFGENEGLSGVTIGGGAPTAGVTVASTAAGNMTYTNSNAYEYTSGAKLFAINLAAGILSTAANINAPHIDWDGPAVDATTTDIRRIGASGSNQGQFYGDVDLTWGTWATSFDNNNQAGGSDFLGLYDMNVNDAPSLVDNSIDAAGNFELKFNGEIDTQVVPEPGTLLLLGTGLLGLVGYARRRKAA
jgi:hypothetical protein